MWILEEILRIFCPFTKLFPVGNSEPRSGRVSAGSGDAHVRALPLWSAEWRLRHHGKRGRFPSRRGGREGGCWREAWRKEGAPGEDGLQCLQLGARRRVCRLFFHRSGVLRSALVL